MQAATAATGAQRQRRRRRRLSGAGFVEGEDFVFRVRVVRGGGPTSAPSWDIRARLSPLYDVVCTVAYPGLGQTLPLGLVQTDDPMAMTPVPLTGVTYADVRELAEQAGEDADHIEEEARAFAERAFSSTLLPVKLPEEPRAAPSR